MADVGNQYFTDKLLLNGALYYCYTSPSWLNFPQQNNLNDCVGRKEAVTKENSLTKHD